VEFNLFDATFITDLWQAKNKRVKKVSQELTKKEIKKRKQQRVKVVRAPDKKGECIIKLSAKIPDGFVKQEMENVTKIKQVKVFKDDYLEVRD